MLRIPVRSLQEQKRAVPLAAALLRAGKIIVIPTETSYGLACDPRSSASLHELFALKGRAEEKPVLLLAHDLVQTKRVARPSKEGEKFYREFAKNVVSMRFAVRHDTLRDWQWDSVVVRQAHTAFNLSLAHAFSFPYVATSANKSDQPAAYSYQAFVRQFPARAAQPTAFFDAGKLAQRPASTIIDCTTTPLTILRQGAFVLPKERFTGAQ